MFSSVVLQICPPTLRIQGDDGSLSSVGVGLVAMPNSIYACQTLRAMLLGDGWVVAECLPPIQLSDASKKSEMIRQLTQVTALRWMDGWIQRRPREHASCACRGATRSAPPFGSDAYIYAPVNAH